jgi:hypothetical protein
MLVRPGLITLYSLYVDRKISLRRMVKYLDLLGYTTQERRRLIAGWNRPVPVIYDIRPNV